MTATASVAPSRARAWLMATRPPTLPAAVVPVLVGTAVAVHVHHFRLLPFLAALVGALLIQVGTNFANDYYDFKKGADTDARLGPLRVTQGGLISPRDVARAAGLTFGAAALVGLYLVYVGGWPILLVGLASIAAGVLYTGGPFPLAYHGLGDVFVFVFFGVIAVVGSYYVQANSLSAPALAASLPVALLATAILVANNVRDIETDRVAGKRTLAVRIGRRRTRAEFAICVVASYAVPPLMWLAGATSWPGFLPWITLPLAVRVIRTIGTREDGPALIGALKGTGLLHMLFGVLFAINLL